MTLNTASDAFVARLNSSGKFLGAALGGLTSSSKYASGHEVATDAKGNVYVTGAFSGELVQGGTKLKSTVGSLTNHDAFLWKLLSGTP